jgi:hypothetical protein
MIRYTLVGPVARVEFALVFGLAAGLATALSGLRVVGPGRVRALRWRRSFNRSSVLTALLFGLGLGLVLVVVYALRLFATGMDPVLKAGLVLGIVLGLSGNWEPSSQSASPGLTKPIRPPALRSRPGDRIGLRGSWLG